MNIHLKAIFSALIFSTLFYSKSLGLNAVLLSILITVWLLTERKKRPISWEYLIAYLSSAFMVFAIPSTLTIIANALALVILVGKSISKDTSIYTSGFMGMLNLLVGVIANAIEKVKLPKSKAYSSKSVVYFKGIVIAVPLVCLFIILYRNANPIFDTIITKIDFSFISIPWVLFTVLGYFLFLNLLHPYYPKEVIVADIEKGNDLKAPALPFTELQIKRIGNEHTIGSIIFLALNAILVFFLVTDVIYLLDPQISGNAQYSKSVHQGVYALMFSIVCAIIVILYFFKGDLNFFEHNKRLKMLTYTWIGLNIVLVIFTFYKNLVYVEALGLTYKRIGVFVYLSLTLIGLLTTYWKVRKVKNFHFLLRSNLAAFFTFLICATAIPWDKTITHYNLNNLKNPDVHYLLALSDKNSQQLLAYDNNHGQLLTFDLKQAIIKKHQERLQKDEEKTWQEYSLASLKTHE